MSINNMSYDIVYYSRCCDLDTAGRQRTIVRFFTRAPSCGSGRQPCCHACCNAIANNCDPEAALGKLGNSAKPSPWLRKRTIVKSEPDLEKGTSAAASEQFLIQAQKKATRKSPFSLPANGISWFYRCNMFLCRVLARSRSRHTMTRNDLCHLKRLHLLQNDRNL